MEKSKKEPAIKSPPLDNAAINSSNLTVTARNVITGVSIPVFKFIINENNVGDPQVELPEEERDPGLFPSLKPGASHSSVVATGESSEEKKPVVSLPKGKYIVSVLAPSYKMGGTWVTMEGTDKTVEVALYPNPLPLSKIRVHVFHDNNPVNGEDDVPLESGIEGFNIIIEDAVGEVIVDYFGNPLGTQYERDESGELILDPSGNPIPIPGTGGRIITDSNGDALIDNLPPGKYGVQAIPPDDTDWIQTTTIEGTHVIDAWIEEGNDGYSPREGFQMPLVWIGFVRPMSFAPPRPWETGRITGRIMTVIEFIPPFRPLTLGDPVDRPWIALSDIGANDRQVYTGRGDSNGNFEIENVPPGLYQMAIWDEPLDYIISFRTVQVGTGEIVNMGDIGIPRWYGYIKGTVFHDLNGNGVRDPGERDIPNTPVGIRDFSGRLITTVHSDINGIFEVLLPSTYTRNVPTPAGVAPGMYRIIGNDPGDPDNPNEHYNPNYQTLVMVFDVWPGKTTYADVALFPITAFMGTPGAQFSQPPQCSDPVNTPQIFRVSRVQVNVMHPSDTNRTVRIQGSGFGNDPGNVTLNGKEISILEWTEGRILAVIPRMFDEVEPGPAQLLVTNSAGKTSPAGITFHLRRQGAYWPNIVRVRKDGSADYSTIQDAIDNEPDGTIVVVSAETYYENPILYKGIKLQGRGPGGIRADGSAVAGSVIDGRFFLSYIDQWLDKLTGIDFDGPELLPEDQITEITRGQVLTVVGKEGAYSESFNPGVDGFKITGARGEDGGGIYVNAHCNYLAVSNNIIQSNGGGFSGGITVGKAYLGNNYNYNISIRHNRILNNGGISLAGGIGIFNGADNYEIAYNEICGNYSAEYGGGIRLLQPLDYRINIYNNVIINNVSTDLGGFTGRVVAEDSSPLITAEIDATYEKTGITLGSGQSIDLILNPETPGRFYLYDREYHHLVNNNVFPGGNDDCNRCPGVKGKAWTSKGFQAFIRIGTGLRPGGTLSWF